MMKLQHFDWHKNIGVWSIIHHGSSSAPIQAPGGLINWYNKESSFIPVRVQVWAPTNSPYLWFPQSRSWWSADESLRRVDTKKVHSCDKPLLGWMSTHSSPWSQGGAMINWVTVTMKPLTSPHLAPPSKLARSLKDEATDDSPIDSHHRLFPLQWSIFIQPSLSLSYPVIDGPSLPWSHCLILDCFRWHFMSRGQEAYI